MLLALLALGIALARVHTLREPLERDLATYSVLAHEMLGGRSLYSDLWDHKPPAIHCTYLLAQMAAGYGPYSLYLLNLLAGLGTLLGVYRAGLRVGGNAAGLWAAVFWALLSGDLYLGANQPNTEVFLNVLLTWFFVLVLEIKPDLFQRKRALAMGFFITLATLYKPTAILNLIFLLGYPLLKSKKNKGQWSVALHYFLTASGFLALAWTLLGLVFFLKGSFSDFFGAVFTYNYFIAGLGSQGIFIKGFGILWPSFLWFDLPLLGVAAAGFCFRARDQGEPWDAWGCFVLATESQILLQGNFFPHDYQLWLPVLVVGGAWGAREAGNCMATALGYSNQIPALCLAGLLAVQELPFYLLRADQWSGEKYGDVFIHEDQTAKAIESLLKPGETFYEWGNETELYFLTRCSPPCGVFYAYPLTQGPLRGVLTERTLFQLGRARPELIVLNGAYYGPTADNPLLLSWIDRNYEKIPGKAQGGRYLFLALKGGQLESRLKTIKN
jgi:4-amino-4-deoxy-L-arabinose transferase-like glycosyltransferase